MESFKAYICIDDTDEIGYEKSTGEISEEIKQYIENNFDIACSLVTRHQLFLHEDIPYTSHNSSMCFTCNLNQAQKEQIKEFIISYLNKHSAPSSQPGLCIGFEKDISNKKELIEFGLDAKKKVLTKDDAYKMATKQGLDLSEHKNEGQGVVGALAGVALRLYGFDGRVKGKFDVKKESMSVEELLKFDFIDEVRFKNNDLVSEDTIIKTTQALKTVFLDHKSILLVQECEDGYEVIRKENLKSY
ncbi:hypothetical protein CRV01_06490 [Arcobacter sp. CECT 8983]|uniref:hypothetical protein n=1 Tax=Arcobacter sp. CECT 8983 TaxID=2044508 RepID=UPI00100AF332|nr:hypothetical protein [Arcobacter sp. CECT 8983]RXJ90792.1 hypothetical protein CRV01_06490 [Arcobacter sp. CECT 8983]